MSVTHVPTAAADTDRPRCRVDLPEAVHRSPRARAQVDPRSQPAAIAGLPVRT